MEVLPDCVKMSCRTLPLAVVVPDTKAFTEGTQLKVVFWTFPENAMLVPPPEQMVWLAGLATTFGVGKTTIKAVSTTPLQPANEGVYINKRESIWLPLFTKLNAGTSPIPEPDHPDKETGAWAVQFKTAPGVVVVAEIGSEFPPLQKVCKAGFKLTTTDG